MTDKRYSFEFYPPKTEKGLVNLLKVRDTLAEKNPAFFSVTYGAGGSTRDHTLNTVLDVKKSGIDTAPHLSCVAQSKQEIGELLQTYKDNGISRIVALRGDAPSGTVGNLGEMQYASDLVEFIREQHGEHFNLEVAAYPEMHPQAQSPTADILNLKKKVEAGANSAITQYFYNVDSYSRFMDECDKHGISIPIYPGIMPITNAANIIRFSDACGAEVPRWIRKRLEAFSDDQASVIAFGEEVVTQLCEKLIEQGIPGIHFYTMNQSTATLAIWNNLKLG